MCGLNVKLHERLNARRGGRSPNGMARLYRLPFRNLLRVHQGEEYARWAARREGETCRDVRRWIIKAGYDGIRVEYHDGGAVEYVAFSNRNITACRDGCLHLSRLVQKKGRTRRVRG